MSSGRPGRALQHWPRHHFRHRVFAPGSGPTWRSPHVARLGGQGQERPKLTFHRFGRRWSPLRPAECSQHHTVAAPRAPVRSDVLRRGCQEAHASGQPGRQVATNSTKFSRRPGNQESAAAAERPPELTRSCTLSPSSAGRAPKGSDLDWRDAQSGRFQG